MAAFKPTAWNPADASAGVLVLWDQVTMRSSGSTGIVRTHAAVAAGKWYAEMNRLDSTFNTIHVVSAGSLSSVIAGPNTSFALYQGSVYHNGSVVASMATYTGWVGIAVDADARTIRFFNATDTTSAISLTWSGDVYLAAGQDSASPGRVQLNTGQQAFQFAVPSGYNAGFGVAMSKSFKGETLDNAGAPAARVVRAMLRTTGELVGEVTSDPTTGEFELWTPFNAYHLLSFHHPDDTLNALVYDWVMPQ